MACFMENAAYHEYNLFYSLIFGLYNIYCGWKTLQSVFVSSNPCFFDWEGKILTSNTISAVADTK